MTPTTTPNTKTNYNGIDLVKFICAFLVLIIHINPFPSDSSEIFRYFNYGLQKCVCRLAVPFFFVASGFFLFKKMELHNPRKDVVRNYCFNLLRLYGLWSALLIVGSKGHLWYLASTFVAILILSFLLRKGINYRWIIGIAVLLYFIGLLGDSYYGITESLRQISVFDYTVKVYEFFFNTTRNGIFMGLIFVLIGTLFAHKKIKMNMITASLGFVFSMILLFVETFLLRYYDIPKDYNMYVFLIPSTIFLFFIASNLKLKDRPIYKKMRAAGVIIYFSHLFVNRCVPYAFDLIKKVFGVTLYSYTFITTVVLCVLLAFLIEHLSHKEKWRYLRWLYS